ncbi:MAG: T9SS type A sorting domain-containing protein [Chitinophagales bacterium]
MKKFPLILFLFFLLSFSKAQVSKRVLFLGNSYTYVNNLPNLIDQLAISAGNDLIYDSNTPGGYTFQGHSTNATSLNKIASNQWDYVVLQEQSQIPSFPPSQVATDCYPYAAILNDSILSNNPCTEPLFYMTWGRKNGDASNCAFYPPLCTYAGMQDRLKTSYMELATNNNASVAPVGVAWEMVRNLYPSIELYSPDESHPSLAGSYLAACVFYSSIFRETSLGLSYTAGLDSLSVYRLQDIASSTVLDSLSWWQIGWNDLSLSLPTDTSFCGDSLSLLAQNVQGALTWSTGENTNPITVENSAVVYANVTNIRGCFIKDSLTINLNTSYNNTELFQACDSIEINGIVYFEDTILTESFALASGCDSVFSQIITIFQKPEIEFAYVFGQNSSYVYLTNSDWDSVYIHNNEGDYGLSNDTLFFTCSIMGYAKVWNACGRDSVKINNSCFSIKELDASWNIAPNPFKNSLLISNTKGDGFSLQVLNLLGQGIFKGAYHKNSEEVLELQDLESGSYFILIYNEKMEVLGKKMIQKL